VRTGDVDERASPVAGIARTGVISIFRHLEAEVHVVTHPVASLTGSRTPWRVACGIALALLLSLAGHPVQGQERAPIKPGEAMPPGAVDGIDAEKLFDAIVRVKIRAVPNARSSATLGRSREGSGVVIGDDGLILTIGYLIVEADDVTIEDRKGRSLAAQVVGYDHATGFGLLRTISPINVKPVVFGSSGKLTERDPVMIAAEDGIAFAYVVSKRPFSGNWEYALDQAIWTSPPTTGWSGAALLDRDGKLLGVGSLIVRDATDDDSKIPGNMFVPIDLLKPILQDRVKAGRRNGPPRPWLGVAADEVQGRLIVTRVSPDGPADRAGVKPGDIILAVGGESVRTQPDFYKKLWSRGGAGTEIPLRLLQEIDIKEVPIVSIDRVEYFRPRTTY
jgi:S1-C subfamily serine protease